MTTTADNCHCGASDHVRVYTDGPSASDWVVAVCGVRRFRGSVFAACRFVRRAVTCRGRVHRMIYSDNERTSQ
jgi:hypothetical protein